MISENKFDRDICGINFASMFAYLDELGKDTSLIMQRTGLTRDFLTSRREYIDLPTGITIFNVVKEILGEKDPMVFYEIGKEATRLNSLGVLIDIAQFLGSVEESVKYIHRFNQKFADIFDMAVYDVKSNSATVVIHFKKKKYDGIWIFDQCPWNKGNIAGIPVVWGLPYMEIEEELCKFRLDEIIRDYSFMGHEFRYRDGKAFLNGKEFARMVAIGNEDLEKATDKLDKMNPFFGRKVEIYNVLSNKDFKIIERYDPEQYRDIPVGMVITSDTRISNMLTLYEGGIFGAPCCRLNIKWEGKKKISKSLKEFILERFTNSAGMVRQLEEELDVNINQKQELIKAQEELKLAHGKLHDYANNLEKIVDQRTAELNDTQSKLLEAEKHTLEHRITGGFAHEMRNALSGAQLEFNTILNYKNKGKPSAQILKDSATSLLKNITMIHEKYGIPRGEIATDFIPELKTIAEIADHLSGVHSGVSCDLDRGLSITTQIRDYARMSEMKPGDTPVDIVALLKEYTDRYRQDFERIGITYTVEGIDKAIVKADEIHLNSIFSNLILNARDALEECKIERSKEIKVTIEKKDNEAGSFFIIKVSDTGPGIPKDHLNEIFEPFFSTKPTSGTGLGLGIVRRLVQLYSGVIDVQSAVHEGTTFIIDFRLNQ